MIALALRRHVSGLAETRLARTALRPRVFRVLSHRKSRLLLWADLRKPEVRVRGPQSRQSSLVGHRTDNPATARSSGFDSQLTKCIWKPAASPPCPRLRPKARQALRALCARADTARSQSLSPRSRRGGLPSGGTSWPQPDAGGGATGLKPSPAILMRGTPPATFMPKLKCTRQRRLRMAQMTCKEKAGAKIKCRGNRCTHGF